MPDKIKIAFLTIRINQYLRILLCTVLFGIIPFLAYSDNQNLNFAGGSGTLSDPYLIANVDHLQAIRNAANSDHFRLLNDIDASITVTWNGGQGFNPVGYFNGSVDGAGYVVSGLVINRPGMSQAAFITQLGGDGIIKDISFENIVTNGGSMATAVVGALSGELENVMVSGLISGTSNVGGLAGQIYSSGSVKNCHTDVEIIATGDQVGGLVGYNNSGFIENSTSSGSVNGKTTVGGLVGKNEGNIINSHSSSMVAGTGDQIGGLIGYNNSTLIQDCSSSGAVSGKNRIGGLIGFNGYSGSLIINCHSTSNVDGNDNVGGLVGRNQEGNIEKSISYGTVQGKADVGGLVGFMAWGSSSINECFSMSDVVGTNNNIGGLVGYLQSGSIENSFAGGSVNGNNKVGGLVGEIKWGNIGNAFSFGEVNSNGGQVGGLIGANSGSSISTSFWDTQTSKQSTSAGGTPKITAEMLDVNTFINAGWDFNSIWSIDPDINDGYPFITVLGGFFMMVWTGNLNSDWENPGNWSTGNLPLTTQTVRIPNVTNQPLISSVVVVNNLNIQPNADITINHNGSLTVTGSINNMSDASGLSIISNENGTGSLIHNNNGVQATFQRYVSGFPEAWHMLSSPMTSQPITGSFTPAGTYGDGTGYDFYTWYEPDTAWVYLLNSSIAPTWLTANGSNDFVPGRGYLVSYQDTNPTLAFEGTLNNGLINIALTKSPGDTNLFGTNLVGNPYPSSIDWKAVSGWDRSVLNLSGGGYDIWIWNDEASNYGVYNSASGIDIGTLGVTRFIAPTQGFFVSAQQNGNLVLNNDTRAHNGADNWLKTTSQTTKKITISVTSDMNIGSDEIMVEFGVRSASAGTKKKFSFVNTAPSLYVTHKKQHFSSRLLSNPESNPVLPLSFKAGKSGFYTLAANYDRYFFEFLLLEDTKTGMKYDLLNEPHLTFEAHTQDAPQRFILHLKEGNFANPHDKLPVRLYTHKGSLYLDLRLTEQRDIFEMEFFDVMGRLIKRQTIGGGNLECLHLPELKGLLIIRMSGNSGTISEKLYF
jgi:hypothetical protein